MADCSELGLMILTTDLIQKPMLRVWFLKEEVLIDLVTLLSGVNRRRRSPHRLVEAREVAMEVIGAAVVRSCMRMAEQTGLPERVSIR